MKKYILLVVLLSSSLFSAEDTWYSFIDEKTELLGYKDKNGVVKINPKYMGFTNANKFENIMAVMEDNNGSYNSYYLTKSGKKVGENALYIYDMSFDCENEGYIRFRDKNGVGLFDSDGEVVISAQYNMLSQAQDGLFYAFRGASIKHYGEHFSFVGGEEALIDINNTVLVKNFKRDDNLNIYSLEISDEPSGDKNRDSFKGVNGRYYSFINYQKEFNSWFFDIFMKNIEQEKLLESTYGEVTYWIDSKGWGSTPKDEFYKRNYMIIENRLSQVKKENTLLRQLDKENEAEYSSYQIMMENLNPFIYTSKKYDKYFDNCSEAKIKYPVLSVVVSHKIKDDDFQDHFDFLRTDDGYKFIQVSISRYELK